MLLTFLSCGAAILIYEAGWFSASLLLKRSDLADVAWGGGFVLAAYTAFLLALNYQPRSLIALGLVTLWGLRLAVHIYLRNRGRKEDRRYAELRKGWGRLRAFLQINLLQGLLTLLVISPAIYIISLKQQSGLSWLDLAGMILWSIGFWFESAGDYQLLRFIKDPNNKGKIMDQGLWHYTRHPNYFGEVTQWWGVFLIALSLPNSTMTIIGPLTITLLILFISGIPPLERQFDKNPAFLQYKQRTSVLLPWFPKSKA